MIRISRGKSAQDHRAADPAKGGVSERSGHRPIPAAVVDDPVIDHDPTGQGQLRCEGMFGHAVMIRPGVIVTTTLRIVAAATSTES